MSSALLSSTATVSADDVPAAEFRAAMATLAAPVTVVTCYDDQGVARGLTASAVSSLSMDPPLFLVCLDRGCRTHDALTSAASFCVNLMGPGNEGLALQFAGPTEQRFSGVELTQGPLPEGWSAPSLADSALRLTCLRHEVVDGGDHTILIGRVIAIDTEARPAGGLLWHERNFAHARPARP
ncbi:flavin reductase family protein [Streptomyces sp. 150FB]|uniref:flavin reductase family protein n=1 Tax=Streptomyces sp. 150FB TaxID=1576605 RepID=UPI0007C8182A|nr:flavin reductase family protein [Streptomyces sp. 150FB]